MSDLFLTFPNSQSVEISEGNYWAGRDIKIGPLILFINEETYQNLKTAIRKEEHERQ